MGLYLRKSFRAGPIRFNLSKSGLGLSGGVKGARIGIGPRGKYVHAGRYGLYYRKQLSSGQSTQSATDGEGCATLLFVVIAIGLGVWLFQWLLKNPAVFIIGITVAIGVPAALWFIRLHQKKAVTAYKKSLDSTFVMAESVPSAIMLTSLKQQREGLPKTATSKRSVERIEADVYQAILDRILDDEFITNEETATIAAAEQVLKITAATRLQTKKEIFSAAYVEAIQDREITKEEFDKLNNLMAGLSIPREEVRQELDLVQEIINTQALRPPFAPIPIDKLVTPIQKNEEAYYQCSAKVLSKRKSKNSSTGYEYTVRREGTIDLTGFFCARLNVVFFNLDEGVNRWRTSSIAPSRRSQNCGKSTCWWAKASRSTKPAKRPASRMSPTTAGARSMAA